METKQLQLLDKKIYMTKMFQNYIVKYGDDENNKKFNKRKQFIIF